MFYKKNFVVLILVSTVSIILLAPFTRPEKIFSKRSIIRTGVQIWQFIIFIISSVSITLLFEGPVTFLIYVVLQSIIFIIILCSHLLTPSCITDRSTLPKYI
jgi:hypothetical protein